jgi:F-type H+-transporting ATPase subunit delta
MRFSKVATVYANALYDFALERKKIREVSEDVASVVALTQSSSELRRTITNPVVKASAKLNILNELLSARCAAETNQFITFLGKSERVDAVIEIFEAFISLKDEREGLLRAEVCSAEKLSPEQRDEVVRRLSEKHGKTIILTEKVDPAVIGGFVVTVGDTIVDASVKNQLAQIKKKLINASLSAN